jgi:hypothetical protein
MDSKLTTMQDLLAYFASENGDPSLFTDPNEAPLIYSHLRTLQTLQDNETTQKGLSTLKKV